MNKTENNLTSLDQFIEQQYGRRGTSKREKFENGYENFKIGFQLQQARIERGMTQEELAVRVGTSKSYISKIENDVKEVRISTLQKIIKLGFGGHLELAVRI
jgi:DNA-binding XRE family transcriptional regulator